MRICDYIIENRIYTRNRPESTRAYSFSLLVSNLRQLLPRRLSYITLLNLLGQNKETSLVKQIDIMLTVDL